MAAVRVVSAVAATFIALACGTNYAYSAWAPEFAEKLKLSSTQSNLIGTFGNLGMYGAAIPIGLLVDTQGVKPGVFMGSVFLGVGYFFQYQAYNRGPDSIPVPWLCLFALMTGVGGCSSFASAIKTCAINWPQTRGTATAFPLAALGLSAFFFSFISAVAFPDDTAKYLLVLTILTSCMTFFGGFFLKALPPVDSRNSAQPTHLAKFRFSPSATPHHTTFVEAASDDEDYALPDKSLLPHASKDRKGSLSDAIDIRGLAMLPHIRFWQLFLLLGLLTGVGLMTVNNIGNNTRALWHHYDDTATPDFIQARQLAHVETLSLMSFVGRLISGIGSDFTVKKLHLSRMWCLVISATISFLAQIVASHVDSPEALGLVSGLNGLAYGFLFGCFPAIVCETFGVAGLSQNWGFMSLAPILSGNVFNLIYGAIYDQHSVIAKDGVRNCAEGLACYQGAYFVTAGATAVAFLIALCSIRWNLSRQIRVEHPA